MYEKLEKANSTLVNIYIMGLGYYKHPDPSSTLDFHNSFKNKLEH